jgi:hypothetical protein
MIRYDRAPQRSAEQNSCWRPAKLSPTRIASMATLIVALAGTGFFAGRVTAQSIPNAPSPKVITRTVTTPPVSQTLKVTASGKYRALWS